MLPDNYSAAMFAEESPRPSCGCSGWVLLPRDTESVDVPRSDRRARRRGLPKHGRHAHRAVSRRSLPPSSLSSLSSLSSTAALSKFTLTSCRSRCAAGDSAARHVVRTHKHTISFTRTTAASVVHALHTCSHEWPRAVGHVAVAPGTAATDIDRWNRWQVAYTSVQSVRTG
jgi:hypothetical protein